MMYLKTCLSQLFSIPFDVFATIIFNSIGHKFIAILIHLIITTYLEDVVTHSRVSSVSSGFHSFPST
jgi:hypothetical protein